MARSRVRIIRACRELGIETVAVYSDADADAPHVREADRAVRIGPPPARESYLDAQKVIAAARSTKADAVHPGYGFLSERAPFRAGLRRRRADLRRSARLGAREDGIEDRRPALMIEAGVPVVPGETPADQSDAALEARLTASASPP